MQDRAHDARTLHMTLGTAQEAVVLALRGSLYLPPDGLLFITRQYINSEVSRSGFICRLKHEGISCSEDMIPKAESEIFALKKTFKD